MGAIVCNDVDDSQRRRPVLIDACRAELDGFADQSFLEMAAVPSRRLRGTLLARLVRKVVVRTELQPVLSLKHL